MLTAMNNPALKLAMARLLSEKIKIVVDDDSTLFFWTEGKIRSDHYIGKTGTITPILETEWLYVMHLVEQTLNPTDQYGINPTWDAYIENLQAICEPTKTHGFIATFNQRATAMCKVKGIEI